MINLKVVKMTQLINILTWLKTYTFFAKEIFTVDIAPKHPNFKIYFPS